MAEMYLAEVTNKSGAQIYNRLGLQQRFIPLGCKETETSGCKKLEGTQFTVLPVEEHPQFVQIMIMRDDKKGWKPTNQHLRAKDVKKVVTKVAAAV